MHYSPLSPRIIFVTQNNETPDPTGCWNWGERTQCGSLRPVVVMHTPPGEHLQQNPTIIPNNACAQKLVLGRDKG